MHLDIVYSQIMTQKDIQAIKELLSEKKNIVIVHHKNADGDAIGSSVALNSYLNLCGHRSNIISPNNFPEFLKWLDNKKEIMIFNNSKNQINLIKYLVSMDANKEGDADTNSKKVVIMSNNP